MVPPIDGLRRSTQTRLLPLATGDRLTRAEFERRAEAYPEHVKVELLDGEVYMSAATRRMHGTPHGLLDTWLGTYAYATPGTELSSNPTLRLDEIAQPQPDALLFVQPEAGGLAHEDEAGYLHGPAELVAEVAASSISIDLHKKKDIYLRNAIREYLVLAVDEIRVFWFVLAGGVYEELVPDRRGVVRSRIFPGLWLDTNALARGDGARVLTILKRGLASKAHSKFAQELSRKLPGARSRKRR
jgi:Uma2 family endonuclease